MPSKMFLDDEAQPHPAQDHHQGAGGDGPHRRPRFPDEGMFVGQVGRGPGEDVAHQPPGLPVALGDFRSGDSLPPRRTGSRGRPGPAIRRRPWPSGPVSSAPSTRSHNPLGWWTGTRAWKIWRSPPPVRGTPSTSRKACSGSRAGCSSRAGYSKVYSQPSESFFPLALHPVGVGDPLAGVRVADGVVEGADLAAEDGPGHEVALLLPLHHLPVPVDQGDVVGRRGLGQGGAADGQGNETQLAAAPPAATVLAESAGDFGILRQVVHLSLVLLRLPGPQRLPESVNKIGAEKDLPWEAARMRPLTGPLFSGQRFASLGVYRDLVFVVRGKKRSCQS